MERKKTIVVTGADRGLGFQLVKQYVDRGNLVFAGKYRSKWTLLDELKERYPDRLHIVDLDVRSDESVKKAAAAILEKTDKIDVLINNAGVWLDGDTGTILDGNLDYARIMEQINVNALGALRVTEALIHAVLNSFDKLVVNVSSEAASITGCYKDAQFGYCMSKAAMNMQSCIVLNGIKRHGGAVLNLHPGWMQSVIGSSSAPDADFVELPKAEDVKFYTTPSNTAANFIRLIDEPERFFSDKPGFVNYKGDVMKY